MPCHVHNVDFKKSCVVNNLFTIYGKALQNAGVGVDSEELALLAMNCEELSFRVKYLTAENDLLVAKNRCLKKMMDALVDRRNQPPSFQQQHENILKSLTSETFEVKLAAEKENANKMSKLYREANAKERAVANEKAQELFLALAEKVSEISGPQVLKSMVWDICGLAVAGIAPSGPLEEGVPATQFTNGTVSWPSELAPNLITNLQGCGYDFVVEESLISEKLASQLQLPPKVTIPGLDLQGDKVPWRCCPVSEIELWKSEKLQASQAYRDLLASLPVEQKATADMKDTGTLSRNNNPEQSARINFLVSYIQSTHDHITNFLDSCQEKLPGWFKALEPEKRDSLEAFSLVLASIDQLVERHDFLLKTSYEQTCLTEEFQTKVSQYLVLPDKPQNGSISKASFLLSEVMKGLKTLAKSRDDLLRENASLHKSIVAKDKKLDEKEAELIRQRDFRSAREERISKENLKMESELSATKQKLDKALKEPGRVENEFYQNVQKLHAKSTEWESKWKLEKEAHDILKLDNEASVKDLDICRANIEKYIAGREEYKREYATLNKELVELRSLQPAQASEAELQAHRKAVRDAKFREEDLLKEKIKLEDERRADEKTIRELSQSKERRKKKLAEMEETQSQVLEELEKERAKSKKLEDLLAAAGLASTL